MKCNPRFCGWFCCWLVLLSVAGGVGCGAEPNPVSGRLTIEVDGVTCEFSPGHEELARLLAGRFAVRNREAVAALAERPPAVESTAPLSPADLRLHRAEYLAAIGASLALSRPTPWQEECYDAFLNHYETHLRLLSGLKRGSAVSATKIDRITIWQRAELVRRLEAGETVKGFKYDPVTKEGSVEFALQEMKIDDSRLEELVAEREALKREYTLRIQALADGSTDYKATASSRKRKPSAKSDSPPETAAKVASASQYFPVVIPVSLADLPAEALAEQLWNGGGEQAVASFFGFMEKLANDAPTVDPTLAFLVFHETTEVGIVDGYYRGRDRRWFCDGVANYVPWRVVRDRHGAELARQVYDLPAQLAKYADLASKVDLRAWPAVERQKAEDKESRLNRARYAYAARAVFLMHERAGEDALPRLFKEIGRTQPKKVDYKTVEKAWQKVAGSKLDQVLADAVGPLPPGQGKGKSEK